MAMFITIERFSCTSRASFIGYFTLLFFNCVLRYFAALFVPFFSLRLTQSSNSYNVSLEFI
jgi:hypothetical protein